MNHPKIIITHVDNIKNPTRGYFNCMSLAYASLAFVCDRKNFRCIKNRFGQPGDDECIPLRLLPAYIMEYENHFTKEDLVQALVHKTTL